MMHQWALAMYRFIAAVAQEYEIAANLATLVVVTMLILDGFVLDKRKVHPWSEFLPLRWQAVLWRRACMW